MSASYGVTSEVSTRLNEPSIEGSENTVDFGEILPFFLLLLPFLSVIEAYFDAHPGE